MSGISTKHTGGDSAVKPSVGKKGHPMQTPGAAGNNGGKMSWSGSKK